MWNGSDGSIRNERLVRETARRRLVRDDSLNVARESERVIAARAYVCATVARRVNASIPFSPKGPGVLLAQSHMVHERHEAAATCKCRRPQ